MMPLGSTPLLTDTSGAVVGTTSDSPYGQMTAQSGTVTTPFGFAGQYTDTQRPEIGVLVHHVPVLERPPFRLLLCQQVTPVRRRGTGRRPAGDAAAQWDRLSVGRGSRRESALHHLSEPRGQPSPSIAE